MLSDWKSVGNRLEDFQCAMGHLSRHSSIEIEYRVRDRVRENHPPVPPLKGGLRCAKKIDIF